MKRKSIVPETLLYLLTEQALLFPVTFSALIMSHASGIFTIYCLVLIFSSLVLFVYAHVRGFGLALATTAIYAALAASIAAASGVNIGSAIAVIVGAGFISRSYWRIKHGNKGFSFYSFVVLGILSYPAAAFIYSHSEQFTPFLGYMAVPATLAVIGSCFCMNLTHLGYERRIMDKITAIPRVTRSSNTFLVILFIAVILVVASFAFIDQLYILLDHIWKFLKGIVESIVQWYKSLFQGNEVLPEEATPYMPGTPPQTETSMFFKILFEIGYYLGLAFISVGIAFAIYIAIKKSVSALIFIARKLAEYYKQFFTGHGLESVSKDYEDEVTSLLKEGESPLDAARRWFSSNRNTDRPYSSLRNNTERARWIYRHSVKKALGKGRSIESAMTPCEVLVRINSFSGNVQPESVDKAKKAYNTARYGLAEPSDSEIEALREFHNL